MRNLGMLTSAAAALLLLCGAVFLVHRILVADDYRVGLVTETRWRFADGRAMLLLCSPGSSEPQRALVPHVVPLRHWIVAKGEADEDLHGPFLRTARFATFAAPVLPWSAWTPRDWSRDQWLLIGCALLLLGFFWVRLAGAVLAGAGAALLIWHVIVVGTFEGLLHAKGVLDGWALAPGFLMGAALGFRRTGLLAYLAQRGALVLVLALLAPTSAAVLGWPLAVATGAALLVPVVSSAGAIALASATCLAIGLEASPLGANLLLVVVVLTVHLLIGGRAPGPPRPRAGAGGRIPIADLVT